MLLPFMVDISDVYNYIHIPAVDSLIALFLLSSDPARADTVRSIIKLYLLMFENKLCIYFVFSLLILILTYLFIIIIIC